MRLAGWLWTTLRGAGWAPLAVLTGHLSLKGLWPDAGALDFDQISHLLGGTAMAYFLARALSEAERPGGLPVTARPLALVTVFCATTTVAVLWEFMEYGIDWRLGSGLQAGLTDTVSDLALGMAGAALYLAAWWPRQRHRRLGAR